MQTILYIGAGSFLGGILRYLLSSFLSFKIHSVFPIGTFAVNILGCFVIGLLFALNDRAIIPSHWMFFFATGLCGGFTTFSAFSLETLNLFRTEQFGYAFLYIAASVLVGLLASYSAYFLFKTS